MTDIELKKSAAEFVKRWQNRSGYEKGESQSFWIDLLANVLGVENPTEWISFEEKVKMDHTAFIDGYIEKTHVLIEQKSADKDLKKPIIQSDGSMLNPFQQAKRYSVELPYDKRPRWIVTCNFNHFFIYDMNQPNGDPEHVELKDLSKESYRLRFLVDTGDEHIRKEMEVSKKAGEIIGVIYDKLLEQYHDKTSAQTLHSLNMLCVRLVFCLYAEDAGIFGHKQMFGDYLRAYPASQLRRALLNLFEVLDKKEEERDPYLEPELAAFPYVNGGLFSEADMTIPHFTDEIKDLLCRRASDDFDWSEISPTIFGAIFESTLNPETRRSGGMHYTSIENIHKVIDPLFFNELREEFENISSIKQEAARNLKLEAFQQKLGSLTFFDPACGSGNFLTETFISLRRLENECLRLRMGGGKFDLFNEPIYVHINQFYGIEINDFAVTVAKTALWIAESQMMNETAMILMRNMEFLPLKSYSNIVEGNALRIDWESVVPKEKLTYIMGNPPFVGAMMMEKPQKEDMVYIFDNAKGVGEMDFVCAWYKLAMNLIKRTNIQCAFVSTNSICQGQNITPFWKPLMEEGLEITFAHRTFRWDSESNLKAHVHCVIVGFECKSEIPVFQKQKFLFDESGNIKEVKHINAYLMDAQNIFIESRSTPLFDVPSMNFGNMPRDGGNLIIEAKDYDDFVKSEPNALKFIHPLLGAEEYINNKKRYCLWLTHASPSEIRSMPKVYERVSKCKEMRLASKAAGTRKMAEIPHLFAQRTQPEGVPYIIVPRVSSEKRRYVPMGFITPEIIVNDSVQIIPNATLYHFGVLTSNVHMAWMRAVCGRLEMRYRYSKDVVYNNFPWCEVTEEQKAKIEATAQAILDARAKYPDSSLADLYDETTMPPELRKAHQANDRAVMEAYGFNIKMTEQECVAALMELYQQLKK